MHVSQRDGVPHGAPRGGSDGHATGQVLLVEPDAAIADLIVTLLTDEGYAVRHAVTPDAARAFLAGGGLAAYDLVLSVPYADPLRAPYAWLDRLRAWARAPVVICACYPAALYDDHRRRGYAAYLEEPFEVQDLVDLVAGLCPPCGLDVPSANDGRRDTHVRMRHVGHTRLDRVTEGAVRSVVFLGR